MRAGILWPLRTTQEAQTEKRNDVSSTNDADRIGDIEIVDDLLDEVDGRINQANVFKPSTLAVSVTVPAGPVDLKMRFICARYRHLEARETYKARKTKDDQVVFEERIKTVHRYIRESLDTLWLPLNPNVNCALRWERIPKGLEIRQYVRKMYADGRKLITVVAF